MKTRLHGQALEGIAHSAGVSAVCQLQNGVSAQILQKHSVGRGVARTATTQRRLKRSCPTAGFGQRYARWGEEEEEEEAAAEEEAEEEEEEEEEVLNTSEGRDANARYFAATSAQVELLWRTERQQRALTERLIHVALVGTDFP